MPLRLDTRQPDFAEQFRVFLGAKREASVDVEAAVRAISPMWRRAATRR